jgi:hypothetical protein
MFKVMILLKRKRGLSMSEFIDMYENGHAALGVKHQTKMNRYIRHYLHPAGGPLDGQVVEPEYDVATEMWFNDQKTFEEGMALLQDPGVLAELAADEETLFDRGKTRLVIMEDRESVLPWIEAGANRVT